MEATLRKVFLVGAGPGDPELLTVKAARLIESADVLFFDKLVNPDILTRCRAGCEMIYVGKEPGRPCRSQDEINSLLERAYRSHPGLIVRLKGGDPFVFGRGGEEAEYLARNGVPFEVVPGISSSIAAAAYAGIPVTHRKLACSFGVVTGHEAPGKEESQLDLPALVGLDTIVFLMAVGNRAAIASGLIQAGRDAADPVAFVENGTTPKQRVIRSTLRSVADGQVEVDSPAVMIVGPVVRLADRINWFLPVAFSEGA